MKLKFNPDKEAIIIPIRLFGIKGDVVASLILDTGASKTMINWNILMLLGYNPASIANRIQIITASGLEYVPIFNIQKIEALGHSMINLPVLCHSLPPNAIVDGLLGMNFFKNKELIIDFRKGEVKLN